MRVFDEQHDMFRQAVRSFKAKVMKVVEGLMPDLVGQ